MMADKAPYLEPEEVLNDWTFSTDAERDRYFRSGLSRREEAIIRSTFVGMGGDVLDVGCGYGRTSRPLAEMGFHGVVPDMACFGKAMANGYPLSAVVGRREVMEIFDEIFFSFTFGGEALSLAAAKATIAALRDWEGIPHLWRQGRRLRDGYNALAAEVGLAGRTGCIGLHPRTVVTFKHADGSESLPMKSLYQQEIVKLGILTAGGFNICWSHSDEDIDRTLDASRASLAILAAAVAVGDVEARLEGSPLEPVSRRA